MAWDLTHECWCSCHIGYKKLTMASLPEGEQHVDEVTRRISCVLESSLAFPDFETVSPVVNPRCVTCGRIGRDRYRTLPDLLGMNLEMVRLKQMPVSREMLYAKVRHAMGTA